MIIDIIMSFTIFFGAAANIAWGDEVLVPSSVFQDEADDGEDDGKPDEGEASNHDFDISNEEFGIGESQEGSADAEDDGNWKIHRTAVRAEDDDENSKEHEQDSEDV